MRKHTHQKARKGGKVSTDAILLDILERLRAQDAQQQANNAKMDQRLDIIEQEIAGVKKTMKFVIATAKVISFIVTTAIAVWNIARNFLPKSGK